jgi:hypothetical protein
MKITSTRLVTGLIALAWLGKALYDYVVAEDSAAVLFDFGGFFSTIGVQSIFPVPASPAEPKG